MIKCAENAVDAKIDYIYSENDTLLFEFCKSKDYQEGDNVRPWYIYANLIGT